MINKSKAATIILWIARVLGTVILAFILFFLLAHVFGEDESGNGFQNTGEIISFILFPISTIIGLSLAYKWEGLGGIITIAGMISLFMIRPDLLSNKFGMNMLIPMIPGVLYTLYWYINQKDK